MVFERYEQAVVSCVENADTLALWRSLPLPAWCSIDAAVSYCYAMFEPTFYVFLASTPCVYSMSCMSLSRDSSVLPGLPGASFTRFVLADLLWSLLTPPSCYHIQLWVQKPSPTSSFKTLGTVFYTCPSRHAAQALQCLPPQFALGRGSAAVRPPQLGLQYSRYCYIYPLSEQWAVDIATVLSVRNGASASALQQTSVPSSGNLIGDDVTLLTSEDPAGSEQVPLRYAQLTTELG